MKKLVLAAAAVWLVAANVQANDVVEKACKSCHAAGVAGAPKIGDKAAWEPRLANGIDALVASVKAGKGVMPAGGGCADCSDADLKAAIEAMAK